MQTEREEKCMRLKAQVQSLTGELQDCQYNYDRDRALWEGKCQFLERQKDQCKRELLDQQKNFEITLQ
jgi:hypothetical protein